MIISFFLKLFLFLIALFLIVLILIQRGKGGGLAGAFGGMGGQSAFGTKAGDTFTRITIGTAAVWILLCIVSVVLLGSSSNLIDLGGPSDPSGVEGSGGAALPGDQAPANPASADPSGPASDSGSP